MGKRSLIQAIERQKELTNKRKAEYDKRAVQLAEGLITYDELGDYADMWFYETTYLTAMKRALSLIEMEEE